MKVKFTIVSLCIIISSGCSSIATLSVGRNIEKFDCNTRNTITRVYSGISNDMRFLQEGPCEDAGFIILDMPFSLVADTVVLPYTIYTQTKYGNLCNKKEELPEK